MHNSESKVFIKEFQKTAGTLMTPYDKILSWRAKPNDAMPDVADSLLGEFVELALLFAQHWPANAFGFNAARAGLLIDLRENGFEPANCKESIDKHIKFLKDSDPEGLIKDPPTDALDCLYEYFITSSNVKGNLALSWKDYLVKVIDKVLSYSVKQPNDEKLRASALETMEQAATGIRTKNFRHKQGPALASEIRDGVTNLTVWLNEMKAENLKQMMEIHPLSKIRQELLLVIFSVLKLCGANQARFDLLHDIAPCLGFFGSFAEQQAMDKIDKKMSFEGPSESLVSLLEMVDHVDKYHRGVGDTARKLIFGIVNAFCKADLQDTDSTNENALLMQYSELLYSNPRFGSIPPEGGVSHSGQYKSIKFDEEDLEEGIRSNVKVDTFKNRDLTTIIAELEQMVGLERVKGDVQQMVNFIKVQQMRESKGMSTAPLSKHLVFYGNPGTGKTTVARLIAEVYKELGLLRKGHLVEVERSGLVGGYVGQTAIKVKEVVSVARGGVLFIDEAYTLAQDSAEGYGQEAIDTLIKLMEDYRDDIVVIVAGYPERMAGFINSNPGLRSRFNKFFDFEDYTAEQLLEIFNSFCRSGGFKVTPEAELVLKGIFQKLYEKRNETFGNGRDVRNMFETILQLQANRIVALADVDADILSLLTDADVKPLLDANSGPREKTKHGVGFRVPS